MESRMRQRSMAFWTLFSFTCIIFFQNCGGYNETRGGKRDQASSTSAFTAKNDEWAVVLPLFQAKCARCHSATGVKPMELFKADLLMNNFNLVDRANPEKSKLYTILAAGTMPKGGPALTAPELDSVRDWLVSVTKTWSAVAPVFQSRCASCHGPTGIRPLDLFHPANLASNTALVNVAAPEQSVLYQRIVDGTMPKNKEPLSAEQTFAILRWIYSLQ